MSDFSDNLRWWRKHTGYSSGVDFVKKLDSFSGGKITINMYTSYENGAREPSFDMLTDIAKALGISTELLMIPVTDDAHINEAVTSALGYGERFVGIQGENVIIETESPRRTLYVPLANCKRILREEHNKYMSRVTDELDERVETLYQDYLSKERPWANQSEDLLGAAAESLGSNIDEARKAFAMLKDKAPTLSNVISSPMMLIMFCYLTGTSIDEISDEALKNPGKPARQSIFMETYAANTFYMDYIAMRKKHPETAADEIRKVFLESLSATGTRTSTRKRKIFKTGGK